jgi:hypothetical protein
MQCADLVTVKVCSSTSPALGAVVASCGSYRLTTHLELSTNTTCTASQIALLSAAEVNKSDTSPFRLTLAEGGLYASAIIGVWITAWVYRTLASSILSGQPER